MQCNQCRSQSFEYMGSSHNLKVFSIADRLTYTSIVLKLHFFLVSFSIFLDFEFQNFSKVQSNTIHIKTIQCETIFITCNVPEDATLFLDLKTALMFPSFQPKSCMCTFNIACNLMPHRSLLIKRLRINHIVLAVRSIGIACEEFFWPYSHCNLDNKQKTERVVLFSAWRIAFNAFDHSTFGFSRITYKLEGTIDGGLSY